MTDRQEHIFLKIFGISILLFFVIVPIGMAVKEYKNIESQKVFDVKATIVLMSRKDEGHIGINHRPTNTNIVVFKVVKDGYPNTFFELNDLDVSLGSITLTYSWLNNHKVGDTVQFNFISSKRFF